MATGYVSEGLLLGFPCQPMVDPNRYASKSMSLPTRLICLHTFDSWLGARYQTTPPPLQTYPAVAVALPVNEAKLSRHTLIGVYGELSITAHRTAPTTTSGMFHPCHRGRDRNYSCEHHHGVPSTYSHCRNDRVLCACRGDRWRHRTVAPSNTWLSSADGVHATSKIRSTRHTVFLVSATAKFAT